MGDDEIEKTINKISEVIRQHERNTDHKFHIELLPDTTTGTVRVSSYTSV